VFGADSFLSGLGENSQEHPIPKVFNAITDFERSIYLLTSQLMWEKPRNKKGDQNFSEVLDNAIDYLGHPTYDRSEAKRRMGYFKSLPQIKARNEFIKEITENSIRQHEIPKFLLSKFKNVSQESVDSYVKGNVTQSTTTCLDLLIRAAYFGGLKKWPVCEYLLRCYSIGGFPTGWIGPLPKNGRGDCEKCMQIVHFGSYK